jgi:poly [ADP-ribose] polymerase
MAHVIESAKSGRAACRKCKEKIAKGELRFGHEVESNFSDSPSYQWYHLKCAAVKLPVDLSLALKDYAGDVPDRDELDATIAANRKKQKPSKFPYAERAPSGRASCLVCADKILKDELRVAVEREVEAGEFARRSAGYLHPQCALQYEEIPDDLMDQVREHSPQLDDAELDEIEQRL